MTEEWVTTAEPEEVAPPATRRPPFRLSLGQLLLLVAAVAACLAAGVWFVSVASACLAILALSRARAVGVEGEALRRGTPLSAAERRALAAGSLLRATIAVGAYSTIAAGVLLAVAADQNWRLELNETYLIGFAIAAIAGYQTWVVLKGALWPYRFPTAPDDVTRPAADFAVHADCSGAVASPSEAAASTPAPRPRNRDDSA
jgi:hypothetical protein